MPDHRVMATSERWARPSALRLDMSLSVGSQVDTEESEFGWEVWDGKIWAVWDDCDEYPRDLPAVDSLIGWRDAKPHVQPDRIDLLVGELRRYLLHLDEENLGNRAVDPVQSPMELFEAGDALSGDLAEVMEALIGNDDRLFCDDCYQVLDNDDDWFWPRALLILREIEIIPQVRGLGIGAWASARSVSLLARDSGTLLATLAAPLHRSDFLARPNDDVSRELTSSELKAWREAREKITQHWRRTLGLTPLPNRPNVLIGTIETAREALVNSLDAWASRD